MAEFFILLNETLAANSHGLRPLADAHSDPHQAMPRPTPDTIGSTVHRHPPRINPPVPVDQNKCAVALFQIGIGKQCTDGAGDPIRTDDLLITNQLLYQLSYTGQTGHRIIRSDGGNSSHLNLVYHST